ncbi:MAG: thermonuclease family protein, partial [Actinomycetota bacterium]|nr:thermonuclease family protein [Actinomycetota bacterium]
TLELHARRAGRVLGSTRLTGVRLLEIDTPETVHPSEPVQCYGPAASDALARLAPVGTTVWVLADQELKDYYDRTLLYLWSDRGDKSLFINRALVAKGFAQASLYEPNDRYITVMYAAESVAKSADRGLWGFCSRFGEPLTQPDPQPEPEPTSAPAPSGGGGNCDPSYSGECIPPYPPDLDCTEISAQGFNVVGDDPHGFDADGDGIVCDT